MLPDRKKGGALPDNCQGTRPCYYAEIGFIKEELGLSLAINPELAAASDIARLIRVPPPWRWTLCQGKGGSGEVPHPGKFYLGG